MLYKKLHHMLLFMRFLLDSNEKKKIFLLHTHKADDTTVEGIEA